MVELTSLFGIDISQQWAVMAGILTVYFLKDKIFDEVSMAKFFAQRRVAKSDNKRAVSWQDGMGTGLIAAVQNLYHDRRDMSVHGLAHCYSLLYYTLFVSLSPCSLALSRPPSLSVSRLPWSVSKWRAGDPKSRLREIKYRGGLCLYTFRCSLQPFSPLLLFGFGSLFLCVCWWTLCSRAQVDKINSTFPSAVSSDELVAVVKKTLKEHGFRRATTTLVTSLCSEQFNRETEKKFTRAYGEHVPIGGLAGFPFGGVQSFEEIADNMVRCGDALIMYGPHLSVSEDGVLQTSCHSAEKAASYIESVRNGGAEMKLEDCMEDGLCVDVEQYFLQNTLMPFGDRLAAAKGDATELPMVLYDAQADMMDELVTEGCKKHEIEGFVCLLGGVQINTPSGVADYFLPMRFELRDKKGQLVKDLMW